MFGNRTKHEKYYSKLKAINDNKINVLVLSYGGDNPYLKHNNDFYIVGVDLSLTSLFNAKNVYDKVYKVPVTNLPFPSNSFDCVCSFDLIGHIPSSQKNAFFKEIHRVLKPEGLSFHYIEVDSPKGYNNWAKKYPKLYKKYFIDQYGHFGLEYYKNTLDRFKKHGFSLLQYKLLSKAIIYPGGLSEKFNNEYKTKNLNVRIIATVDNLLSKNKIIKAFFGIILKPLEIIFEPLIPKDYGGLLFVVHKKEV